MRERGRRRVGNGGGGDGPDGAELLGVVAVGEEVGGEEEVAGIGERSDVVGDGEVVAGEEVHKKNGKKIMKEKKKRREGFGER